MNDGVLVEALRARDPGALAALYDIYAENLYRYCRTLLAGPDAAQVALRDTLIAAEALVGSLADPQRFRPWLYALARGECMRRRTPGPEDGQETGPVPVPTMPFPAGAIAGTAATVDTAEIDLRVVASSAVGALSPEDREVLELAARHGMAGQDLAAVLGTGERYAEGLLDAATERLRETVTAEILARRATHDCERATAILAEFTGDLTPQERTQLIRHLARCEVCGLQRVRQVSAAKVFGLLPQVALPETLRVRVLSSFIDPELVPYRRYVAKRVGGLNAAGFPRAGRREGRLAQAVAGAVAALAAVATIALVFAQFAGDLREEAADTIAPRHLPTAEVPAGPSAGSGSPDGPQDADDEGAERSPAPQASRGPAEPVAPVRQVALPRPAPLPPPAPPTTGRPHHPAPPVKPSARPTSVPSATASDPAVSPSGPTPVPTVTPDTPGEEPSPGGQGSGGPGSGGPGSGGPGSGGPGSGGPGPVGPGPGGPWPGRPHRGGPPPAHWPGHHPPWREHQHHSHAHREWPPSPPRPRAHGAPVRGGYGGGYGGGYRGGYRGGYGVGHEAWRTGSGRPFHGRPIARPKPGPYGGAVRVGKSQGQDRGTTVRRPGRDGAHRDGPRRDDSHRDGPGPGWAGSPQGGRGPTREGGRETGAGPRGAGGDPAGGRPGSPGSPGSPGNSGTGPAPGGGGPATDPERKAT
ncbi:sigma-70 family RNA polymerase sigma factor [Microbispora sp. H11081]|uniref:sigma-70 family RNA polymerase sigma factor n=1 Tax=Microbispora sp. H11081 TaxID=2729107 RepID=UPI0014726CF5|nr:sigma-70 family RNA polymerase sigma factor [Microbispora sp. H11081]